MSDRERRARERARWPIRAFDLGAEPIESVAGTPEERIAWVERLTADAWAMRAEPMPECPRHRWPGRVIRSSDKA